MPVQVAFGNVMPLDRCLVFRDIIRDVRNGNEEWSMTAVKREWAIAIREYRAVYKNGYAKHEE